MAKHLSRRMVVVLTMLLLGAGASARAQERTYEGDVVAVDGKANTFTVKASKPGQQPLEMAFHVSPRSELLIGGQRVVFAELVKGDHVTVTYESTGDTHTVRHADRHRTVGTEMSFTGDVTTVDLKAQTFTVKSTSGGTTSEMQFHFRPGTRLYLGGDQGALLAQLRPGEKVTVTYETTGPSTRDVKHVKKSA